MMIPGDPPPKGYRVYSTVYMDDAGNQITVTAGRPPVLYAPEMFRVRSKSKAKKGDR